MDTSIPATPKKRIDAIDVLRGIVMVLMALDHTRDFFTISNFDPTNLSRASTALFLTRFVTHYCAASFVFLAGTGAFLSLNRGKTKAQASRFLLTRGLWLIFLELTVIGFGWGGTGFLQVIWAIGVSMVVLSVLIYLPLPLIAGFGLLLIFGHNLLDNIDGSKFGPAGQSLWTILHVLGPAKLWGDTGVFVLYPLVPWIGVMAAGYAFGSFYLQDPAKRKRALITLGVSAIALFIIIRSFNFYGDPSPWTMQPAFHRTILSFINVSKYPPSLDYLLVTIGPAMLALAFLEGRRNKITNFFVVFGRVPLFYYIIHIYLIHFGSLLIGVIFNNGKPIAFSLPVMYLWWLLIIAILYFPSRWFMRYKQTHKQWWLSYL